MLHMGKALPQRRIVPKHLKGIMEVIENLIKIVEMQGWKMIFMHYPKHHPMMREVDAVGRLRAYRTEDEPQMNFPDDIWKGMLQDSQVWQEMRRRGLPEPTL